MGNRNYQQYLDRTIHARYISDPLCSTGPFTPWYLVRYCGSTVRLVVTAWVTCLPSNVLLGRAWVVGRSKEGPGPRLNKLGEIISWMVRGGSGSNIPGVAGLRGS